MKFLKSTLILFLFSFLFTSCYDKVPPGHKGVLVTTAGSNKGNIEVKDMGYVWVGRYQDLYVYPVFIQNFVWTQNNVPGSETDESISFQSKEGMEFSGDFAITFQIHPDSVKFLFGKFRRGLEEITDVFIRNSVRDALSKEASKLAADYISGEGKEDLIEQVESRVKQQMVGTGIRVDKVSTIGKFRIPASVQAATEAKINATQKAMQAENELRRAEAEAKATVIRAKAEGDALLAKAKAESEANRLMSQSVNESLIKMKMIDRWDGKLPQVTDGKGMIIDFK
jgi:regulator of protease activity HflC (stomatin/prohibitin superfamily)